MTCSSNITSSAGTYKLTRASAVFFQPEITCTMFCSRNANVGSCIIVDKSPFEVIMSGESNFLIVCCVVMWVLM